MISLSSHKKMNRYFAYGSNMSQQQILDRCPGASREGVGTLKGHRLAFTRRGSYRPGGVASVVPAGDDESVYGVVWKISDDDLSELDRIEDPDAYARRTMTIELLSGNSVESEVYVAFHQEDHIPPSPAYLDLIICGAIEAALPGEYISRLCDISPLHTVAKADRSKLSPGSVLRTLKSGPLTDISGLSRRFAADPTTTGGSNEKKLKATLINLMGARLVSARIDSFANRDDEIVGFIRPFPSRQGARGT